MGNKQRSSKVESKGTPDAVAKKPEASKPTKKQEEVIIKYSIIPDSAKYNKIDLVKYGQIFDDYQPPNPIETAIKEIHLSEPRWYLNYNTRDKIQKAFGGHQQFPLRNLLRFCVTYNQNEMLEFICTQELIECLHWDRDFFLSQVFDIILWSSKIMKLSALNVIASYMIPERINKEDFKQIISEAFQNRWNFNTDAQRKQYENLCRGMVEEGMNGRARRIIETRNALRSNMDDDFPNELIGVVIVYAFGMAYKR